MDPHPQDAKIPRELIGSACNGLQPRIQVSQPTQQRCAMANCQDRDISRGLGASATPGWWRYIREASTHFWKAVSIACWRQGIMCQNVTWVFFGLAFGD